MRRLTDAWCRKASSRGGSCRGWSRGFPLFPGFGDRRHEDLVVEPRAHPVDDVVVEGLVRLQLVTDRAELRLLFVRILLAGFLAVRGGFLAEAAGGDDLGQPDAVALGFVLGVALGGALPPRREPLRRLWFRPALRRARDRARSVGRGGPTAVAAADILDDGVRDLLRWYRTYEQQTTLRTTLVADLFHLFPPRLEASRFFCLLAPRARSATLPIKHAGELIWSAP